MKIELSGIGKRFNRDWIFRELSFTFLPGKKYAVTGPNGSGKSTLLQVISGASNFQSGSIAYSLEKAIPSEKAYQYMSMAAPYLDLIEEMTLVEFIVFHGKMKGWNRDIQTMLEQTQLKSALHKQIRNFSSGMKQRVKLLQAFYSEVEVILVDEPTSNLDEDGILFYENLVANLSPAQTLIIGSNDKTEYRFCDEGINIMDYK